MAPRRQMWELDPSPAIWWWPERGAAEAPREVLAELEVDGDAVPGFTPHMPRKLWPRLRVLEASALLLACPALDATPAPTGKG